MDVVNGLRAGNGPDINHCPRGPVAPWGVRAPGYGHATIGASTTARQPGQTSAPGAEAAS